MATSFKSMFPKLFDPIYSPKTYTFGYSSAQRCKRSCESFSEGLFGNGLMQWYSSIHWFPDNLMLRVGNFEIVMLKICCVHHFSFYSPGIHAIFSVKIQKN